jgi:subfamily B ATP-binding cassette protein MsbA
MAVTISRITRLIREITSHTQDKLADVNTRMEESLSGIRVIQSFSAEKHEIARFNHENEQAKELFMYGIKQQARLKPSIDVIGAAGIALALWIGGRFVVSHELTIGDLGLFVGALNKIAVGINSLGAVKVTYEQVQAAGGRILENVLDVESDIRDAPDAVVLPPVAGHVEFRNVDFAYNAQTPVLRNLSFVMNPGEVVAVVGPSGSGKSTISDLIPRFYDPESGEVLVDGRDLRDVTIHSLRSQIGIVPQETMLFGGTIRENIAYGRPDATDEMIVSAARAANAHDFISDPGQMPLGYKTVVGQRGVQLSGGQRQRIAIARALLKDPRILILDEATSSLDTQSEQTVQDALETLMRGRTTLVIAHRLSTIQSADKILVLQEGRIVEAGKHADLLRRAGLYAELYAAQRRHDGKGQPSDPAMNASEKTE